ncbi:MAG TPA: LacI family DNA-binding transcriptional regulator [Longimicrobiales bacterium]
MKNPTISDVATLAGVSKSTVSAVLNNKNVTREATRRAVLRAIEELNYRPSRSARRGFRPVSGKSIAFIAKESQNPYYAEILAGIVAVAQKQGYLVSMNSSERQYRVEHEIVEQCMEREVTGLIITPTIHDDVDLSHLFELKRHNIPFVLLEDVRGVRASLVDVDNVIASYQAVRYLIEHGHSSIVHFGGPVYSQHSQERIEGVRRAFSESHLKFTDDTVVPTGDSPEKGYETALQHFREHARNLPTAVTCYNDLVAIGVLTALRELGIAVPEEVSVIGFDDLDILRFFPQRLTTVRVPKYEMGYRAAELLIRQIESHGEHQPEKVALPAELVIRETTRALDS